MKKKLMALVTTIALLFTAFGANVYAMTPGGLPGTNQGAVPALATAPPIAAGAALAGSMQPPAGYVPADQALIAPTRGLRDLAGLPNILMIQNHTPWAATKYMAIAQTVGVVTKSTVRGVESKDLLEYDLVVFVGDQTTATYGDYPYIKDQLEKYVSDGGILLFSACDGGWNGGTLTAPLPGGLTKTAQLSEQNAIRDFGHPVVTGELTGRTTALTNNDLWSSYVSHNYFNTASFPADTRVIIQVDAARPTLVEYPIGFGAVVATTMTWEYDLDHGGLGKYSEKAYKDLLTYAISLNDDKFTFEIGSATVQPGEMANILVSVKNNPGISGFDLKLVFENNGDIANVEPKTIKTVSGTDFINDDKINISDGFFYSNLDAGNAAAGIDWNNEYTITQVWSMPEDVFAPRSDLYVVSFWVSEDAEEGVYNLDLSGIVVNSGYEELEYAVRKGKITVVKDDNGGTISIQFMYGNVKMNDGADADGNEVRFVDINDLVRVSQSLGGTVELGSVEKFAMNVDFDYAAGLDENGKRVELLSMADGVKLAQWLAGYASRPDEDMGKGFDNDGTPISGYDVYKNALQPVRR